MTCSKFVFTVCSLSHTGASLDNYGASCMRLLLTYTCTLQRVVDDLEKARNTNRELKETRKKLELDLQGTRKQFEAQELVRGYIHCICTCTCTCTMYVYVYI